MNISYRTARTTVKASLFMTIPYWITGFFTIMGWHRPYYFESPALQLTLRGCLVAAVTAVVISLTWNVVTMGYWYTRRRRFVDDVEQSTNGQRIRYRFIQTAAMLPLVAVLAGSIWFTQYSAIALFMAVSHNNAEQVRTILGRGVSVNSTSMGNTTPLMVAVQNPDAEICRVLLGGGASINTRNMFGNTALILACRRGRTDVVRLLLSRGADVNVINNHGQTAMHEAHTEGHSSAVIALLQQAGAKS